MASHLVSQHQQSAFATPINGGAGDATVVLGNDNDTVTTYNGHDADATIHVQDSNAAVFAATPAATAGRKWMTTDTGAVHLFYDTGSVWVEVNYLRTDASGSVTAGTDADTTLTIGSGGASPTSIRTARLILNAPSDGGHLGQAVIDHERAGTIIWETGVDSSGASGAKTSDTDYYWYGAGAYKASLTTAGSLRLAASLVSPIVIGGSAVGSSLEIRSTTGVGTTDFIKFTVGNNGATEAARILNGGNVLFGCTTVPSASVAGFTLNGASSGNISSSGASTAAFNHLLFVNGNGTVGSISTSATTTTYATSSDARLKDARALGDVGAIIDAIAVYDAAFLSDPSTRYPMLLAQQLYNVAPFAVRVGGDDPKTDPWMVDHSMLVPLLFKEVQSLRARLKEVERWSP